MKNKIYSFINIGGLALGLGVAIALGMTIHGLVNMDQFHENKDSVYKLAFTEDSTSTNYYDASSALLAPTLKAELPEVVDYCQYMWTEDKILGSPDNHIKENGFYVDEGWFRMLSFPLKFGNIDRLLSDPGNIVLSEKLAKKLFGDINPVGKTLNMYSHELNHPESFYISGVYKDVPVTSTLQFEFAIPFDNITAKNQGMLSWDNIGTRSFIQLGPDANPEQLSKEITKLIRTKNRNMAQQGSYTLAPLGRSNGVFYTLSGEPSFGFYIVIAIVIIGISILLISILNYINLSVATSLKRAKEIGVRKMIGARRKELSVQFVVETSIVVIISSLIAYVLQFYIVQLIADEQQAFSFNLDKTSLLILSGLLLFTILFTAWYPAIYMSRFSPLNIQKGSNDGKFKLSFLRRTMVTFQFFIAILLITTSVIISSQVDFMFSKSIGMDKYNTAFFVKNKLIEKHMDAFSNELEKSVGIQSVTFADQLPISIGNATTSVEWEGKDESNNQWFSFIDVGDKFVHTMGINLLEGRDFSSGDNDKIVINKSAADKMGMQNPVGNILEFTGRSCEIIGMVDDFSYNTMSDPKQPVYLRYNPDNAQIALVRFAKGQNAEGIKSLEKVFGSISPDFILDFSFLDQQYNANYKDFKKMKTIISLTGFLAIVIACLGLLGLTVHASERRLKELSIRKINGARVKHLVQLLSGQMVKSILIAAVLALPVAFLLCNIILQNFPEHIGIGISHFVLSLVILFGTVILIVGWQVYKAATRNPVEALRYE